MTQRIPPLDSPAFTAVQSPRWAVFRTRRSGEERVDVERRQRSANVGFYDDKALG